MTKTPTLRTRTWSSTLAHRTSQTIPEPLLTVLKRMTPKKTTEPETDDTDADTGTSDTDPTDTSTDTNDTSDTESCSRAIQLLRRRVCPHSNHGTWYPAGTSSLSWIVPSIYTYAVDFAGTAGFLLASHEGLDYVHGDANPEWFLSLPSVLERWFMCVPAAHNRPSLHSTMTCEKAAGGWATIVVDHGNQIFTRYAHF